MKKRFLFRYSSEKVLRKTPGDSFMVILLYIGKVRTNIARLVSVKTTKILIICKKNIHVK